MKKCFQTIWVSTRCLLLSMLLLAGSLSSNAVSTSSKGTDFWLMFNTNYTGAPDLTLFITSSVNTSGTISGASFSSIPFTVTANTVTAVTVPTSLNIHTSDVVDNKGVHVTALNDVTVYGLNYIIATADAFLGFPTDVLGKDYLVMSYANSNVVNGNSFGIVGTVNSTIVTITPSSTVGAHTAGIPYNITLNQGDAYQLVQTSGTGDLTGTVITSTDPVGVFGASQCANVPGGYVFCDHITEMLPPTPTWGKKFGTVPLASRTNGDTWRFMASTNGTTVSINGVAQTPVLNAGEFIERILTSASAVTSDKPILATQFANGSSFSGNPGDPFMMVIPPLEQFLGDYTVTNVAGYVAQFINIIAPNAIVSSVMLDGVPIPAASFTAIGATGYSGAQITTTTGSHHLSATQPFGVFVYGFNTDDAYGYPGGQSFAPIAIVNSVSITPTTGTDLINTNHCWDAMVKDQNGNPLAGIVVHFDITGANPGSTGFAITDALGVAHFCYSGANAGTDNIVASVGTISSAIATFIWTNCHMTASIADVNTYCTKNTIYKGYGPTSITIGVSALGGTAPLSYSWSPGGATTSSITVSPSSATMYTVTVTDANHCTASASVTVKVKDVRCGNKDDKVMVCHNTGSSNNPNNALCISPNAVPAHMANHGDCLGDCTSAYARIMSGSSLTVAPNPNNGVFQVTLPWISENAQLIVTDLQGKVVLRRMLTENDGNIINVQLGNVPYGLYLLDVYSEGAHQRVKLEVR